MTRLFDLDTPDLDLGYRNIHARASATERRKRDALEEMWAKYEDFADRDFRDGFARDPDARFWELCLSVAGFSKRGAPSCPARAPTCRWST
jgi:hypothetical protein